VLNIFKKYITIYRKYFSTQSSHELDNFFLSSNSSGSSIFQTTQILKKKIYVFQFAILIGQRGNLPPLQHHIQ